MSSIDAFILKNRAYWRNSWRLLRNQSQFKIVFIAGFALFFEIGLWILFHDGFRFLDSFGVGGLVTMRLFSLFFLGLGMMLVMSGVVTSYATLFRSDEIPFLLSRPIPVSHIVLQKFYESALLSSWAFFFVILPFVGAYAWHQKLSMLFALWTLLFAVPFLAVCAGLGMLVSMLIVACLPRMRILKFALVLLGVCGVIWAVTLSGGQVDFDDENFSLAGAIPGMTLSANRLIPSTWMAEGILSMSRGVYGRGLLYFGNLLASAMLVGMFVEWLGRASFYRSWQRVETGNAREQRHSMLFRCGDRLLGFLPSDIRAMIMKDIRTFFRDPMQWSQALVFFGLLGIYFANLQNFNYHLFGEKWRNMIAFLNVFSVAAVVCSLGARFVYPQLSLEGQGFWVLGLAPTSMRRVFLCKFGLALFSALVVSMSLILLSSMMLRVDPVLRLVSVGLSACIGVFVAGLSTGLGAVFIDLRERNPAAIVGGFGGTLNLVLGLAFMLLTILPFAFVFHLWYLGALPGAMFQRAVVICVCWLLLLTVVSVAAALIVGLRALERREY